MRINMRLLLPFLLFLSGCSTLLQDTDKAADILIDGGDDLKRVIEALERNKGNF